MPTVTNGYIFSLRERQADGTISVDRLAQLETLDVPARVSYHLQKLIKKLALAYVDVEAERVKLVNKLREKREDGTFGFYLPGNPEGKPVSPNWEQFAQEFNELMAEKVDVDTNKVILPGDTRGIDLTKLLGIFEPFIEVGE